MILQIKTILFLRNIFESRIWSFKHIGTLVEFCLWGKSLKFSTVKFWNHFNCCGKVSLNNPKISGQKQRTKNSLKCWEGQLSLKSVLFPFYPHIFIIPLKPRARKNKSFNPGAAKGGSWHGNTAKGRRGGNHILPSMWGCFYQRIAFRMTCCWSCLGATS